MCIFKWAFLLPQIGGQNAIKPSRCHAQKAVECGVVDATTFLYIVDDSKLVRIFENANLNSVSSTAMDEDTPMQRRSRELDEVASSPTDRLASTAFLWLNQDEHEPDLQRARSNSTDALDIITDDAHETSEIIAEQTEAAHGTSTPNVEPKDDAHTIQYTTWYEFALDKVSCTWWVEIAALGTAAAVLLALFGTLYVYQDKPSPNWPNWLSLNAIVAIYIAILKMSVLLVAAQGIGQLKWHWFKKTRPLSDLVRYDDASRGPFGALVLLLKPRKGQLVAALGALIMVLALPADVFAQQIIRYYECSVQVSSGEALMSRSNYYEANTTTSKAGYGYDLIPDVVNAFNAGLYSPGASPGVDCLTGNCSWAEYSSVGMCNSCEDISHKLRFKNQSFDYDGQTYWNLTTIIPGKMELVSTTMASNDTLVDESGLFTTYAGLASELPDKKNPVAQIANVSIDFALARNMWGEINPATGRPFPDCDKGPQSATWPCIGYGASRCFFYPCIKTYNATMHSGRLRENLLATVGFSGKWPNPNGDDWPAHKTLLDTKCIDSNERLALNSLGYKIEIDQRWMPYRVEFPIRPPLPDRFPESMMTRGCLYGLGWRAVEGFGAFFQYGNFLGNVEGTPVWNGRAFANMRGAQGGETLYNYGNVTFVQINDAFTNISVSLTNFIRQNGVWAFSKSAQGTMSTEKACITIRWPLLSFPIALVLVTLVFLVTLISITRGDRHRQSLWKSSPLALLYHGFANRSEAASEEGAMGKLERIEGMKALARVTRVKMSSDKSTSSYLEVQDVSIDKRSL